MSTSTVMTAEGIKALREEIEHLETIGRREIAERIKIAREWGDLRENAEYQDAKNDQALLETKIAKLQETLRRAVEVEIVDNSGTVSFGCRVKVLNKNTGKEAQYTLVSSAEADASTGKLSLESPVGRALLGHKAGDLVVAQVPRGEFTFEILEVN